MDEEIIKQVEDFFEDNIPKTREREAYLRHVNGVRKYGLKLAKVYNGNEFVVEIAALLHDVGADAGPEHANESAKISKNFLEKFNLKKEDEIIKCIEGHSMGSETDKIEQQIIQDADGIIFIEDTYKSFFEKGKKKTNSLDEAKKWAVDKTKGMMAKIKTDEGMKIAEELLPSALEWIENQ